MNPYDDNYYKHFGWEQNVISQTVYQSLWSVENLETMQRVIMNLLDGVREDGRRILVPIKNIAGVLSTVYSADIPSVGSINSRYIQDEPENARDDRRRVIDKTIEIIVSQLKTEILMEQDNQKLTIFDSILGDFNQRGLRAHAPIKIKKRHPAYNQIAMRY